MIAVVDTSALVRLTTLRREDIEDPLLDMLAEVTPHAPDIVDAEFHHALRGLVLGAKVASARAELARELFKQMPLVRMPTRVLTDRVWSLRHTLGAYDACFLAFAEALAVPLVTCDAKQAGASGHHAEVHVF